MTALRARWRMGSSSSTCNQPHICACLQDCGGINMMGRTGTGTPDLVQPFLVCVGSCCARWHRRMTALRARWGMGSSSNTCNHVIVW